MTKTTCDICGNLITDGRENWLVSIQSHVGVRALQYDQKNYETTIGDVCSDCANSIYHYIEGLKKPLDKSTES